MKLTNEDHVKLKLTLSQMNYEIDCLYKSLEAAPVSVKGHEGYDAGQPDGFLMDEYLLKFRLGNVQDLSMHLLETLHLSEAQPK